MKTLLITLSLLTFAPQSAFAEDPNTQLTMAALMGYAAHFTASSTLANHGVGYAARVFGVAAAVGLGTVVYMQGKDKNAYRNVFPGVGIGVSVSALMNIFQKEPETIREKVEVEADCGDPIKWDRDIAPHNPVINNNITIHNSNGKEGAK